MKRIGSGLTILLMAIFLVSAVGLTKDVTLHFWHAWGGPHAKLMREVLDKFEEQNPGIKVEVTIVPWDMQIEKLLTSVVGGNPPSVLTTDNMYVLALAARGALEPIESLQAKTPSMSEDHFPKALYEGTQYQGHNWGVIWNGGTMMQFWNKDVFREVGLDPESPPESWNDLTQYTDKINVQENGKYKRFGFVPTYGTPFFVYGWLNGGNWFNKDKNQVTATDPKNVEALQWAADFYDRYDTKKVRSFEGGFGSQANSPFYVGQLGMMINGSWQIGNMRSYAANVDYGATGHLPVPEGGEQTGFFWGNAMVLPKGVKHKEEAWKLITYLTTEGALEWFKRKAEHFTYKDYVDLPELQSMYQNYVGMREAFDAIAVARPLMLPAGPLYMDALSSAVDYTLSGQKTPEQALRDVQSRVQNEVDTF